MTSLLMSGIRNHGYGIIFKIIFFDNALSLTAKAIYAYLCSFSGSENAVFPSKRKMADDLGLNIKTLNKHFKTLICSGYISLTKIKTSDSKYSHNAYVIVKYPKKLMNPPKNISEKYAESIEKVTKARDIAAAGFGFIPQSVMTSTLLSAPAKGLYANLCAFANADGLVMPDKEALLFYLDISDNSYNYYVREIKYLGLVESYQEKRGDGKFSNICYQLSSEAFGPYPKIWRPKKRDPKIWRPKKRTTNNNNIGTIIKNKINYNPSISPESVEKSYMPIDGPVDSEQILYEIAESGCLPESYLFDSVRLQAAISIISSRGPDNLSERYEPAEVAARKQLYELFNTCLCEMLNGNGEPTRVNGAVIPYSAVYKAMSCVLRAGFSDSDEPYATLAEFPDHVISEYIRSSAGTKIRNHKAYLKAVIWTSLTTMFISEFTEMVHDFANGGFRKCS